MNYYKDYVPTGKWCVEFWRREKWSEWDGTRRQYKEQAVQVANYLNRTTNHDVRVGAFGGHRFRVRRVKED